MIMFLVYHNKPLFVGILVSDVPQISTLGGQPFTNIKLKGCGEVWFIIFIAEECD